MKTAIRPEAAADLLIEGAAPLTGGFFGGGSPHGPGTAMRARGAGDPVADRATAN